MSTENTRFVETTAPVAIPFPGVGVTQHPALGIDNSIAESAHIPHLDDPRWIFAMRARLIIEDDQLTPSKMNDLSRTANQLGLSPMHANAIIGSVERAYARGSFDRIAQQEIMNLPMPHIEPMLSMTTKSRWITFGVLFVWALSIAGLMQIVV